MGKLLLTLTFVAFSSGVLCNVVPNVADTVNSTLESLNQTEGNSRVNRAVADSVQPTMCRGCVSHVQRTDYTVIAGMGAFKLHTRVVNWYQARKSCMAEGGQLVIINSHEEATMLLKWIRELHVNSTWLGVHDLFEEGDWVTMTGETLEAAGYDRWKTGEPDNVGILRGENCGFLDELSTRIRDEDCYLKSAYICKIYIC